MSLRMFLDAAAHFFHQSYGYQTPVGAASDFLLLQKDGVAKQAHDLMIITFAISLANLHTGIFGMNLESGVEEVRHVFSAVATSVVAFAFVIYSRRMGFF